MSRLRTVNVAVAGACLLLGGLSTLSTLGVSAAGGAAPVTLYAGASASGSANCSSPANACTLSTAIGDTAPGDVVALVTAGVEGSASTYYSGGFSIGTPGTSAALPVVIEPAPGVTNPILDGGSTQGVFDVTNDMHLVIDGVTIQNGNSDGSGGGITNDAGGVLTVNNSTFTNNTVGTGGGAIDNGSGGTGTLTVNDSTFADNTAGDGGAIDNGDGTGSNDGVGTGTLTVNDSTFTGNGAGVGGAIDNGDQGTGTLTVTDSTFTGNGADYGGAIDNDLGGTGTLTVSNSTFSSNTAEMDGGAIDNADNSGLGTLSVSNSTFTGNSATFGDGGAIDNGDDGTGTLTVTNSTFTGNSAGLDGGTIDNGFNGSGGGTGNGRVAADIFAGSCFLGTGSWTDLGYNVGSDTSCQNGGTGDAVSGSLASELAPLANNGGPTQTLQLLAGNPAAGLIPNDSGVLCPVTDQTGAASPPGAPCNAGALQIHPVVKSVKIGGTASVPKVTIKGSGFGIVGNLGPAFAPTCGAVTGSDYTNTISVFNVTRNWDAGRYLGSTDDCIGLLVTSYSGNKIAFHFGSDLGTSGGMHTGDKVKVALFGTTTTITAPL
jgi:trimeric autotransporter adhesin